MTKNKKNKNIAAKILVWIMLIAMVGSMVVSLSLFTKNVDLEF